MSALPVMASTIAKQALQAFVMQEIDVNGEAEYLRRVTSDKVAGEILYAAYRKAHFNLIRLRRKKLKLQHQLETVSCCITSCMVHTCETLFITMFVVFVS